MAPGFGGPLLRSVGMGLRVFRPYRALSPFAADDDAAISGTLNPRKIPWRRVGATSRRLISFSAPPFGHRPTAALQFLIIAWGHLNFPWRLCTANVTRRKIGVNSH